MKTFKLSTASLSTKTLITSLILTIGLVYLTLVFQKYLDTGMSPFQVAEGYEYMEYIELTDQAHLYLPYYSLFIFAAPVFLLMFSSFSEGIKRFFAVFPFIVIFFDTISIFLIPYVSKVFAFLLWSTGSILGITLAAVFIMLVYDVWVRKMPATA